MGAVQQTLARAAGERRPGELARNEAERLDAECDRVTRPDRIGARERRGCARPAASARDAADERLIARRLADAACVGALEEQRAASVVMPGLTGLPMRPGNSTATATSLARASTPPTMPCGQTSCQVAVADCPPGAGITTQGPVDGDAHLKPAALVGGLARGHAGEQRRGHARSAVTAARITGPSGTTRPRGRPRRAGRARRRPRRRP